MLKPTTKTAARTANAVIAGGTKFAGSPTGEPETVRSTCTAASRVSTAVAAASAQVTLITDDRFTSSDTSCVVALVSVVVPVFNGMPYLRELTQSILEQSYEHLDIVFSEGGGTDESITFLRGIADPRVRIVQQPPGTSAAQNWTAATQTGTGEFIKLICQDDLLHPTAIARQVEDLTSHPEAVMAVAQRDVVDAQGRLLYARRGCSGVLSGLNDGTTMMRTTYLKGGNIFGEPLAVLFRRDALLAAMPWDGSNPLVLDLSLYAHVAMGRTVVVRKESVGSFRVSESSWSTRLARVQLRQFRQWQAQFARTLTPPPSGVERARARLGVRLQTTLRRGAYTWLRLRRSFKSQERDLHA